MNLEKIQEAVGRKCSLMDGSGNFIDGLVTADDITALANQRWLELHTKFVDKFPDGIEISLLINLVEDQGDYDLLETGKEGITLNYVGVKYATTDTYYKRVKERRFNALSKVDTNEDKFSTVSPFYSRIIDHGDSVGESEQPTITQQIRLRPIPTADATAGLYVRLVENPIEMTLATDTPYTLPNETAKSLIVGYIVADVWEMKRDWANSNEALNRAILAEKAFFENYQPTSSDEPVRIDIGKTYNPYRR